MSHTEKHRMTLPTQVAASAPVASLLLAGVAGGTPSPWADDLQDAQQLVEEARLTFESFQADPQMGRSLRALVRKAKRVLIYPQVLRGAFIFGGAGGSGVFLARKRLRPTSAPLLPATRGMKGYTPAFP